MLSWLLSVACLLKAFFREKSKIQLCLTFIGGVSHSFLLQFHRLLVLIDLQTGGSVPSFKHNAERKQAHNIITQGKLQGLGHFFNFSLKKKKYQWQSVWWNNMNQFLFLSRFPLFPPHLAWCLANHDQPSVRGSFADIVHHFWAVYFLLHGEVPPWLPRIVVVPLCINLWKCKLQQSSRQQNEIFTGVILHHERPLSSSTNTQIELPCCFSWHNTKIFILTFSCKSQDWVSLVCALRLLLGLCLSS